MKLLLIIRNIILLIMSMLSPGHLSKQHNMLCFFCLSHSEVYFEDCIITSFQNPFQFLGILLESQILILDTKTSNGAINAALPLLSCSLACKSIKDHVSSLKEIRFNCSSTIIVICYQSGDRIVALYNNFSHLTNSPCF